MTATKKNTLIVITNNYSLKKISELIDLALVTASLDIPCVLFIKDNIINIINQSSTANKAIDYAIQQSFSLLFDLKIEICSNSAIKLINQPIAAAELETLKTKFARIYLF